MFITYMYAYYKNNALTTVFIYLFVIPYVNPIFFMQALQEKYIVQVGWLDKEELV